MNRTAEMCKCQVFIKIITDNNKSYTFASSDGLYIDYITDGIHLSPDENRHELDLQTKEEDGKLVKTVMQSVSCTKVVRSKVYNQHNKPPQENVPVIPNPAQPPLLPSANDIPVITSIVPLNGNTANGDPIQQNGTNDPVVVVPLTSSPVPLAAAPQPELSSVVTDAPAKPVKRGRPRKNATQEKTNTEVAKPKRGRKPKDKVDIQAAVKELKKKKNTSTVKPYVEIDKCKICHDIYNTSDNNLHSTKGPWVECCSPGCVSKAHRTCLGWPKAGGGNQFICEICSSLNGMS